MPLAVSLCAAPAARPRRVAARRRSARACATPDAQTPSGSCPSCGVAKANMKCDGSGRQQGGIGAVPGFTWWPIKAFRPCPSLVESGGTYNKKGQDLDEVMFGKNR